MYTSESKNSPAPDYSVMADSVVREGHRWVNTSYFREAGQLWLKNGVYTDAPYGSRDYRDFWDTWRDRCLDGYTVGGVRVTGYHMWFMNFSPMNIVIDPTQAESKKMYGFPRFWDLHYDFFHDQEASEKAGKNFAILKPRGTGFSEIFSAMAMRDYTLVKRSKSFFFASNEGFLNKDGVLTKAWDKMEFLNQHTQRGLRRLRQVKNSDLHKRASYVDGEGNEKGMLSEIIARVIDDPEKVRGARTGTYGKVYFEEAGSFPHLRRAIQIAIPLVKQGGVQTGQIVLWGTGGEEGKSIEGLDHIFYHPRAYNMMEFDNIWDEDRKGTKSGWFFPVFRAMDRYTDKHGNVDQEAARKEHDLEREEIKAVSPKQEDRYRAEYPYTPQEALTRLSSNVYPIAEAQRQLTRIRMDQNIQGFLKYGWITHEKNGLRFSIDPKAKPLKSWPNDEKDTKGCITMVESPYRDSSGKVPDNLYTIVLDPYYKDEAEQSPSLGAAYVYKHRNAVSRSEDNIIVAWYVARPHTTQEFHRNLFLLARFYNAKVQSEIAGGGKGVLDYARVHKLLHLCELEPDILITSEKGVKRNKNYFINTSGDFTNQAHMDLADWFREERSLTEGDDGEIISTININKIYDEGLLEEIIKFNDESNFDRLSAMRILPYMIKERIDTVIKKKRSRRDSFWNRRLYSDYQTHHHLQLTKEEIQGDLNEINDAL